MIRVGRKVGDSIPHLEGFETCLVLTKSSKYGELGPYVLKTEKDIIFENWWQFSKLYPSVPEVSEKYSRWDSTIIWSHPSEVHIRDGEVTPEYWEWRKKGFSNPFPVRYPVGFGDRHRCLCSIHDDTLEVMDYITSRKKLYLHDYCRLVKKENLFESLLQKLRKGKNLLIVEVDGPHQESLGYYKDKYGVGTDFITDSTIEVNFDNMKILLNDEKHPFGHGYCLGIALFDSFNNSEIEKVLKE